MMIKLCLVLALSSTTLGRCSTMPNVAPAPVGGTAASKMLQDPEARESTTSEYIYAYTPEEAESICQRIAARRGWRLDRKQAESFINSLGKQKYTCYWTIFEENRYDDDQRYSPDSNTSYP